MILDSSAIIALLTEEPGAEELFAKLQETEFIGVGAPTLLESTMVLARLLKTDPRSILAEFLHDLGAFILGFGDAHQLVAANVFLKFGKGRHPAALNMGDCLAYATARIAGHPLLCTGDDFSKTDLELA
jgi:ribonuclease VapC